MNEIHQEIHQGTHQGIHQGIHQGSKNHQGSKIHNRVQFLLFQERRPLVQRQAITPVAHQRPDVLPQYPDHRVVRASLEQGVQPLGA